MKPDWNCQIIETIKMLSEKKGLRLELFRNDFDKTSSQKIRWNGGSIFNDVLEC